jgi:hypothetical protein
MLLPVLLFRFVGGFAARLAVVLALMTVATVLGRVLIAAGLPEQRQGCSGLEAWICSRILGYTGPL